MSLSMVAFDNNHSYGEKKMMNRKSKITGTHTTFGSDLSRIVVRVIDGIGSVNKIVLGIIKTGLNGSGQRVKIVILSSAALKLMIFGATTVQEIYVYGDGGFAKGIRTAFTNNKELRNVKLKIMERNEDE